MAGAECCGAMQRQIDLTCDRHADANECPDKLVARFSSGSYVLRVHDGGTSGIVIAFCPWCGEALPSSD